MRCSWGDEGLRKAIFKVIGVEGIDRGTGYACIIGLYLLQFHYLQLGSVTRGAPAVRYETRT